MGKSFGYSASGRMARACDGCSTTEGVRQRNCTAYVLTDSIRSVGGQRHKIRVCPGAALCSKCNTEAGGARKMHADCHAGAPASQAKYDAAEARYQSGDPAVIAAFGTWHERCPEGWTLVLFQHVDGSKLERFVPSEDYRNGGFLSDYPRAVAEVLETVPA